MLTPRVSVVEVEFALRIARAASLFAASGLALLGGRWGKLTSGGFAVGGLLVLAFASVTSATSLEMSGLGPVLTTGGAAVAVALLIGAAAAPEVNDAASRRQLLAREAGAVAMLALLALTPFVDAVLLAGSTMPLPSRIVLSGVVAAGWLLAGKEVRRSLTPRLGWLPPVLLILAAAAVARVFIGVWSGSLLVALGLGVLAGGFALVGAVREVRAELVGATDGMTSMLQDLLLLREEDSRRRAEEVERLHEVRSLLGGLRAATGSLRRYENSLDPSMKRRLEDAVSGELIRLNRLIDPGDPEATEELDLERVVMPVVVAERERGLVVTTDLADVSVLGRSAEIATLVSDLLVNARVHARGSAVRMTARADGGMVRLQVRDWGAGLSAIEAQRVFERGYRGVHPLTQEAPGSGLGLYTARKLARQMHGDLSVLTPADGGCCFVVTFPAARQQGTREHHDRVGTKLPVTKLAPLERCGESA